MGTRKTTSSVPLPPAPAHAGAGADRACPVGQRVGEFLSATGSLSCEAAAELAGVRAETIRKWRRRLPRWLREATSRRMAACLAGKPPPDRHEGFQRLFRQVLRSASGAQPASAGRPPPEFPP